MANTAAQSNADTATGSVPASTPSLAELRALPGVLRHLCRITGYLPQAKEPTAYIHVYARPTGQKHAERLHVLAPPLDTLTAQDSGMEGIACVDDVARAVVLAARVYEVTSNPAARELASSWLRFLYYMQPRSDTRLLNFILDTKGTINTDGKTSYPGGEPWTIRTLRAYATVWRVFHDRTALRRFQHTIFPAAGDLQYSANYALALLDIFETRPHDRGLRIWITDICEMIIKSGPRYFRAQCGQDEVPMYDYHQLQAVARAGKILGIPEYIKACEMTVTHFIEPAIEAGFYHVYTSQRDPQSVFDVSSIGEGLEALYYATENTHYRELALACCAWLDGNNPAKTPVYDPETGRCHDKVYLNGEVDPKTGAESAIEAGYLQLIRYHLNGDRAGLDTDPSQK